MESDTSSIKVHEVNQIYIASEQTMFSFQQCIKKLITIAVNEIIRIEADGDYSSLIIKSGKFLSNYGISKSEQSIDNKVFIRVHRSSIINLNCIWEVNRYVSSYDVVVQNGDIVWVSREYMDNLKKLMFWFRDKTRIKDILTVTFRR